MNKVIMMGRLVKDPEISSSASGTTFARYSIAVDRKYKSDNGPDADFFNCSSFGKQAEFVEKYLKKGTKVVVSGRLENNNYTNKEGHKVYDVKIVVEDVEFAESKGSQTQQNTTNFLNVPEGLVEELPFS
jgi:single-strand DNA-binding protein